MGRGSSPPVEEALAAALGSSVVLLGRGLLKVGVPRKWAAPSVVCVYDEESIHVDMFTYLQHLTRVKKWDRSSVSTLSLMISVHWWLVALS